MSDATAQHLRDLASGARWYREQGENLQRQLDALRVTLPTEPWQKGMPLRLETVDTHDDQDGLF